MAAYINRAGGKWALLGLLTCFGSGLAGRYTSASGLRFVSSCSITYSLLSGSEFCS